MIINKIESKHKQYTALKIEKRIRKQTQQIKIHMNNKKTPKKKINITT